MDFFPLKKQIIALAFMLCSGRSVSQNLIKNPSFEDFAHCPLELGNFDGDVNFWSTPTEGSTDYFNGCSQMMGTPKNFNGNQPADFGDGYAGLYLYAPDDYREYVQAELTETLIKDQKYRLSFYVSLAERSDFAIKEFGVLFSNAPLRIPSKKELSKSLLYKEADNMYHFLEIKYGNFYSDTQLWILVHTQFVAKGTEKYMTIGNFKNNSQTRMFRTKRNAKQGAYYYLDMVLLEVVKDLNAYLQRPIQERRDFELDKVQVFKSLLFAFDESIILENAKKEMEPVYEYLSEHPEFRITINGHTDNVGSRAYNQKLSEHRAKAVAEYLEKKGLPDNRISWVGFGGNQPVALNDSETGRRQNRRVEFVITKVMDKK